jgi:hypothetical protein
MRQGGGRRAQDRLTRESAGEAEDALNEADRPHAPIPERGLRPLVHGLTDARAAAQQVGDKRLLARGRLRCRLPGHGRVLPGGHARVHNHERVAMIDAYEM